MKNSDVLVTKIQPEIEGIASVNLSEIKEVEPSIHEIKIDEIIRMEIVAKGEGRHAQGTAPDQTVSTPNTHLRVSQLYSQKYDKGLAI